jgi:hypothetical protein
MQIRPLIRSPPPPRASYSYVQVSVADSVGVPETSIRRGSPNSFRTSLFVNENESFRHAFTTSLIGVAERTIVSRSTRPQRAQ